MEIRPTVLDFQLHHATPRNEVAQVRGAIVPDLAPPAAVTAQNGAEQTRWLKDKQTPVDEEARKRHETSIERDRETGDLVYKVVDSLTQTTIEQYPYEVFLKMRAYLKTMDAQRSAHEAETKDKSNSY